MALKVAEKKIGDLIFTVTQLGLLDGSRTLLKLTKAVGPSIEKVAKAVTAGATGTEVLGVVMSALQSLPEAELEALIKTFAASTKVQRPFTGTAAVTQKLTDCLDDVMGGDYMTLLAWLVFAVEVNYFDFFANAIRTMSKDESPPKEKAE